MKKALVFLSIVLGLHAQSQILSPRDQAVVVDQILKERIDSLLPSLMEKTDIDMWVIISREYNEDPVIKTFLPATWLSARRRTIIVFYYDQQKKIYEKLAIARYDVGETIKASWDMQKFPDQWDALIDIIVKRNPKKIGVNISKDFAHADGMDHTEYEELVKRLPAAQKNKVVSAEKLAVAWLETRTEREMEIFSQLVTITHDIIDEGFSEKVITPGVTTTDDVVWWFRKKLRELELDTWFHPSVSVQRNNPENFEHLRSFSNRPKDDVIRSGDLLHVDFGITYLRLNTDCQQHAYVLRPNEKDVPVSLQKAFQNANRVQDILTSQFALGKSGNEVLKSSLEIAAKEGLSGVIYTHPLGTHGHAAGPTIGMWDNQNGIPGSGDYPVQKNTAYSIELNAGTVIPEWGKQIRIMLEEDGFYDGSSFRYINGRQKKIYIIPRVNPNMEK